MLLHVGPRRCHGRKQPGGRRQQVVDLGIIGPRAGRVAAERDVGRAHEHQFRAEREHEHRPAVARLGIHAPLMQGPAQRGRADHEVAPLRAADEPLVGIGPGSVAEPGERAVGPGPRGVDDRRGAQRADRCTVHDRLDDDRAVGLNACPGPRVHREGDPGRRRGRPRIDEELDGEPLRPEELRVGVGGDEWKPARVDRRQVGCAARQHAVAGPACAAGEQVVERETYGNGDAAAAGAAGPPPGQRLEPHEPGGGGPQAAEPALDRQAEGERPHEVAGEPHEPVPFGEALAHQGELAIFEVAQAAVDEPGGPGRRAGRDVGRVDDDDRRPGQGKFPGDRGPVDAGPEDDDRAVFSHASFRVFPSHDAAAAPATGQSGRPPPGMLRFRRRRCRGRPAGVKSWPALF